MNPISTLFNILTSILGIGLAILFIVIWVEDFKWTRKLGSKKDRINLKKISWFFIIVLTLIIITFNLPELKPVSNSIINYWINPVHILIALSISVVWFLYLRWIDIYEKEPYKFLLLVFGVACITIYGVFPIGNFFHSTYGFQLNGSLWNDWWYCVLGIGLTEESVKILPVILLLRYTKQVNEPVDYLIYASVSALGFAFIENIQYLNNHGLHITGGRAIYAALAHMLFTSVIAYGLAINKFKHSKYGHFIFPITLLIAALAHGFYDFWLINPLASNLNFLTLIFMLISIKIWIMMTNNLLNISNHYKANKKHDVRYFKYWVFLGFLTIFLVTFFLIHIFEGSYQAREYIYSNFSDILFLLLFVTISLSSFDIIHNYIQPIKFPNNWRKIFIPNFKYHHNQVGKKIIIAHRQLSVGQKKDYSVAHQLPIKGKLIRRMVVEQDKEWYLFAMTKSFSYNKYSSKYLLIKSKNIDFDLDHDKYHTVEVLLPKNMINVEHPIFYYKNTLRIKNLLAKHIRLE